MWNVIRRLHEKPLTEEICEVFDSVAELRKLGENLEDPDNKYHYLRISDICAAFRGVLLERGILLVPEDVEREVELVSDKTDGTTLEACTVKTKFSVKRRGDVLELGTAFGYAKDRSDKALAIAQTAALKAQLKRMSLTYGKDEDPETNSRETLGPRESVRLHSFQRRAWDAAVRESGLTHEKISDEMSKIMGFAIWSENVPDLPVENFEICMQWLSQHQDLSTQWGNAFEAIKARKPQPVVNIADAQREIGAD